MKKECLKVKGMACTGCENRIQNRFKNIEGISKIKADFNKAEVEIEYDESKVSNKTIKEIINNLGFEA